MAVAYFDPVEVYCSEWKKIHSGYILRPLGSKSNEELNIKYLKDKKLIRKDLNILKILGKGEIKEKLKVSTNFVSKSAKSKIEKAGGSINILQKKEK